VNKGRLKAADLVTLRLDGTHVSGRRKASTEADMHRFVYESRPDVHAVVHAHPTYATAFAAARIPLNLAVFPEVIVGLGPVPLAEYATPSTTEVRDSLRPHIGSANAILLANHGVITFGGSLDEAMNRMEKLEHFAHMLFLARQLGGERLLTRLEYERLKAISKTSYGKEIVDSALWKTS
jgi:L-fuculose-phosphate aldolase